MAGYSGRQLTPFGQGGGPVLFEYVAADEVAFQAGQNNT